MIEFQNFDRIHYKHILLRLFEVDDLFALFETLPLLFALSKAHSLDLYDFLEKAETILY